MWLAEFYIGLVLAQVDVQESPRCSTPVDHTLDAADFLSL